MVGIVCAMRNPETDLIGKNPSSGSPVTWKIKEMVAIKTTLYIIIPLMEGIRTVEAQYSKIRTALPRSATS